MATSTHLFNIIFRVIDKASEQLNRMQSASSRAVNNIIRQSTLLPQVIRRGVVEIPDMIAKIDKAIAKTSIFNNKMLGLGLGMTFFMWGVQMQLQRMLRSMFNTFTLAEGETGALNQQFNIIRANLAAVSIAFWDAFAQSGLFDTILNFVMRATDWFLNLSDATREWIASFAIKSLVLVIGIQMAGQAILVLNTLGSIFDEHIPKWQSAIAGAGLVLTIGLAMKSIKEFVEGDMLGGILSSIETILSGVGTYGMVTGKFGVAGTAFTLLVGLKLARKNMLFEVIGDIIGTVAGFFGGLQTIIEDSLLYTLRLAYYNVIQLISPLLKLARLPIPEVLKPAVLDIGQSFETGFKSNYQWWSQKGKDMDEWIATLKENTEATKENTNKNVEISYYPNNAQSNPVPAPVM